MKMNAALRLVTSAATDACPLVGVRSGHCEETKLTTIRNGYEHETSKCRSTPKSTYSQRTTSMQASRLALMRRAHQT